MKNTLLVLLTLTALSVFAEEIDPADVILVGFRKEVTEAERQETHRRGREGRQRLRTFHRLNVEVVRPAEGETRAQAIAAYRAMPEVAFAQRNFRYSLCAVPDDPSFLSSQWNLHSPTAGINVTGLWDHVTCATNIIVAVIDTGINYAHADLKANMWVNPNPSPGTNDVYGARWTGGYGVLTNGNPLDDHSHGSHVAGIIGAVGNNGTGISGICWSASLMALKIFTSSGSGGYTADIVAAIEYAVDHGARIINASFGGADDGEEEWDEEDDLMYQAIDEAGRHGVLFVAAAGNYGSGGVTNRNIDIQPVYPAAFSCTNIIAVTASTSAGVKWGNGCYSPNVIHLAAPGDAITSTRSNGDYSSGSGTSYAAPHVVGAAALLWAVNPHASMMELRQAIFDGAVKTSYWATNVVHGRLSVQGALDIILTNLPIVAPVAPASVSFRFIDSDTVELSADFAPPAGTRYRYDILSTLSLQSPILWHTNQTVDIFWPADALSFQVPVDPSAASGFFKAVPRTE